MSFDRAFEYVVGEEGGYVNDPQDPGGETKYGISKRSYPGVDIKNLTLAQAKDIYKRDFWDAQRLDSRPWHQALVIFDCAVNQGHGRVRQILDRIPRDGEFVVHFQAERALHYASLPTFSRFGRGWMRRLIRTAIEAQK